MRRPFRTLEHTSEARQCKHILTPCLWKNTMAGIVHSGGGQGTVGYGGGFVAGVTSGDKTRGSVRS